MEERENGRLFFLEDGKSGQVTTHVHMWVVVFVDPNERLISPGLPLFPPRPPSSSLFPFFWRLMNRAMWMVFFLCSTPSPVREREAVAVGTTAGYPSFPPSLSIPESAFIARFLQQPCDNRKKSSNAANNTLSFSPSIKRKKKLEFENESKRRCRHRRTPTWKQRRLVKCDG